MQMPSMFLLGIDGLPRWMWQDFADRGIMPNSAQLLQTGTLVPMRSSVPEVSSAAWASIVTGENPGGHNVYGFTDLIDGTTTLAFTSSRTFRAKPFWSADTEAGRGPSLVLNCPQTYPAQPLNGQLVSGFVALDLKKAVYPESELDYFTQLGYRIDADMSLVEKSKERFVRELFTVLDRRCESLHHYWDARPWQSVMFVITGTDRLNHYLWEDYEDTASPLHQQFLDFYHEVDRQIGRIIDRLPDQCTLCAVSDHGFARQRISVNINALLAQEGFLHLAETERPSYKDMTPETTAFAMDPGRIYLHRKGRYPKGLLEGDACDETIVRLRNFFHKAEINGHKLVSEILRGSDVHTGPFAHRAPDLILMAAENVALSGRMNLSDIVEPTLINGKHTFEESTFFCRGINLGSIPETMRVEDVLSVIRPEAAAIRKAA